MSKQPDKKTKSTPKQGVKGSKRHYRCAVVIRGDVVQPLPDYGLGRGVLLTSKCTFTDKRGQGFNTQVFADVLKRQADALMREVVEVRWVEIKPGKGAKPC
jgi:hypothetical protein